MLDITRLKTGTDIIAQHTQDYNSKIKVSTRNVFKIATVSKLPLTDKMLESQKLVASLSINH